MQIGVGAAGILLGEERSGIAARFRGRYREFFRTSASAHPTGVVDDCVFACYDEHDRVALIEVAEPCELIDADGRPVPLSFRSFVRWLGRTPFSMDEVAVCVVPSLSLALTFELDDEDRVADESRVTIASMGVPGCFGDE